jgi:hypothetical protein
MKSLRLVPIVSLVSLTVLFSACEKEGTVIHAAASTPYLYGQTLSASSHDSLTGKEFVFDELVWAYDVDGAANLYLGIENRPDLFCDSNRPVIVSLKPNSQNTWVTAEKFQYPNSSEFVFSIYSRGLFIFHNPQIFPWSPDTHLAGNVFSVRVKFL